MLLGLSGYKGSGKTTVADYLRNYVCLDGMTFFQEYSWAFPLKEVIGKKLLGLTHQQIYDEKAKEDVDLRWGKSPRQLLQIIGTDCFRDKVHSDFWIKVGEPIIKEYLENGPVVISDNRFPNELDFIKKTGGYSVRIIKQGQVIKDSHASEHALDNYRFDFRIIAPAGNVDILYEEIEKVIAKIQEWE